VLFSSHIFKDLQVIPRKKNRATLNTQLGIDLKACRMNATEYTSWLDGNL